MLKAILETKGYLSLCTLILIKNMLINNHIHVGIHLKWSLREVWKDQKTTSVES